MTIKVDVDGVILEVGDIVSYTQFISDEPEDLLFYSEVKFGEYMQDGSGGKYIPSKCYGLYLELNNVKSPNQSFDNGEIEDIKESLESLHHFQISPFEVYNLKIHKKWYDREDI